MQLTLEEELLLSLIVAPNPQITAALGAAEMAVKKYRPVIAADSDFNHLSDSRLGFKALAK